MNMQALRKADMQPSYAQEVAGSDVDHGCYGSMINCLVSETKCCEISHLSTIRY